MPDETFREWNHFVPELYLKRFAYKFPSLLWRYPLLVPRRQPWRSTSVAKAGAHSHLYTSTSSDERPDEVERWLAEAFDTPAVDASIQRAVTGQRMCPEDWHNLARFWAAQDQRTFAAYFSFIAGQPAILEAIWDEVLGDVKAQLTNFTANGTMLDTSTIAPPPIKIPFKALIEPANTPGYSEVTVHSIVGRRMWLDRIRYSLREDGPIQLLYKHRWTILRAPDGVTWFTSDSPALKSWPNRPIGKYVEGCWDLPGTILSMPLSPKHLLYTCVGLQRPYKRDTTLPVSVAKEYRAAVARYAFRNIFSSQRDGDIEALRPQHIDLALYREELKGFEEWHTQQSQAERGFDDLTSDTAPA